MKTLKLNSRQFGFTLIELLVVISIVALLSSVIFASINVAKVKAQDSKKVQETNSIKTAIVAYAADHFTAPPNYNCSSGTCVVTAQRASPAAEDLTNPTNPTTESGKAYNASLNTLVAGGYLAAIPHSSYGAPYTYYYYPSGTVSSNATAVFGSTLSPLAPSNIKVNSCKVTSPCPKDYVADYTTQQCYASDPTTLEVCDQYGTNDYCSCVAN